MKPHPSAVFASMLLFCGSTFSGCVLFPSTAPPAWIDGESQEFPSKQFLIGVGEGNSRIVAEQRAYVAVARIFQTHVEAEARDSESYFISEREGTSKTGRELRLDHVTQVSTKKVLENVMILARWEQPHADRYLVLAGMDRRQSEKALIEELAALDQAIEKDVRESRTGGDTLTKVRRLKRAIRNTRLREDMNADLRIIRVSGTGNPPVYQIDDLKNELDRHLRENLDVRIQIQGDQESLIRRALLEGLTREGFVSTKQGQPLASSNGTEPLSSADEADLLITGVATLWKVDLPDPIFVYVRWCADLLVLETTPQRIIGVVSRSGREGHITQTEAFARASKAMQAAVTSDVTDALSDLIYGEVEDLPLPSRPACPR